MPQERKNAAARSLYFVDPAQRALVRMRARPFVDDVVGEIKVLGNDDFEIFDEVFLARECCLFQKPF